MKTLYHHNVNTIVITQYQHNVNTRLITLDQQHVNGGFGLGWYIGKKKRPDALGLKWQDNTPLSNLDMLK